MQSILEMSSESKIGARNIKEEDYLPDFVTNQGIILKSILAQ
jgi:hypothetical protein